MAVLRKRKPKALPFNQQISQQRRNLLQGRQGYLRNYRDTVQDLNRSSTNQLRDIDIEAPNIYRNVLNNFAGRGMAYSSGYGTTLGNAANQITNQRSNIQSGLTDRLSDLRADRRRTLSDYRYNLSNLTQQQAGQAEDQAGNLGFNRSKKKKKIKKKKKGR